jgi:predicted DNA-binding WGR domain protein
VNRCGAIDSNIALDVDPRRRENPGMTNARDSAADKLQMLVLERRDPSRDMARFYVLAIEPTLFGDVALAREWGRIGTFGRRRLDLHADVASAAEALDVWLARKSRRGYQIRASRLLS